MLMKKNDAHKPTVYYDYAKRYDYQCINGREILIHKHYSTQDKIVEIVPVEEYFQKLTECHEEINHGKREKMMVALKERLYYIPRHFVGKFLELCEVCRNGNLNRSYQRRAYVTSSSSSPSVTVVATNNPPPVVSDPPQSHHLSRGHFDLIDMSGTPDGRYRWLLVYQDHRSKFISLRPLESNLTSPVAMRLFKIFSEKSAPLILQSSEPREFTAAVVQDIQRIHPQMKIVHGQSVERINSDIDEQLSDWMAENNSSNWSLGLYIVQHKWNNTYHQTIRQTPFRSLYKGDQDKIPRRLLGKVQTEEELQAELGIVENAGETVCGSCANPLFGNATICEHCGSVDNLYNSIDADQDPLNEVRGLKRERDADSDEEQD